MIYQEKFVVAIKSGGKVLKEAKDIVYLPYGSEFTILVKNLNSRRAKFTLHIDGQDVLDGTSIIVDANSDTEIKRYIRNGNMNEGNAFKFIERTSAIENGPRGIKVDDGIVRVEYWFEKEKEINSIKYENDWWDKKYPQIEKYTLDSTFTPKKGIFRSNGIVGQAYSATACSVNATNIVPQSSAEQFNDIGITVPGSKVDQKFTSVYDFISEYNSHVIVMRLKGVMNESPVKTAMTAKTKQKCATCSHINKAGSNFCSACGTALTLL